MKKSLFLLISMAFMILTLASCQLSDAANPLKLLFDNSKLRVDPWKPEQAEQWGIKNRGKTSAYIYVIRSDDPKAESIALVLIGLGLLKSHDDKNGQKADKLPSFKEPDS